MHGNKVLINGRSGKPLRFFVEKKTKFGKWQTNAAKWQINRWKWQANSRKWRANRWKWQTNSGSGTNTRSGNGPKPLKVPSSSIRKLILLHALKNQLYFMKNHDFSYLIAHFFLLRVKPSLLDASSHQYGS